jgi:hypothetical protein
MIAGLLSGRIRHHLAGCRVAVVIGLQGGDDAVQVVGDLLVHLHHPGLPAGLRRADDLQGLAVLFAVLR